MGSLWWIFGSYRSFGHCLRRAGRSPLGMNILEPRPKAIAVQASRATAVGKLRKKFSHAVLAVTATAGEI